jgi:hypothetical protein
VIDLGDVLRLLSCRGFKPAPAKLPKRKFVGHLSCSKGLVPIELTIEDWDFFKYPKIVVSERPPFLPSLMPHCDVHGDLCYFAPQSVTLDRYDPTTAILQCLDRATQVLSRIADDPAYREEDIQLEFQAHWNFGQLKEPWHVLLGDVAPMADRAPYFFIRHNDSKRGLVTSTLDQARQLCHALGAKLEPVSSICWLMQTNKRPPVQDSMPSTVKQLLLWLRSWDRELSSAMQKVLGEKEYLKQPFVIFSIRSPDGWIGFGFDLDQMKRIGYARRPKEYRNFLHNAGGNQPIFRVAFTEVGSSFVHSRNLSFPDLHNKRITLVGCGAIGSFLGNALARLGAGTGKLGCLKLIDHDSLSSENLGRHTLGYPDLFKPKSEALRSDLARQFPLSRFEAVIDKVNGDHHVFAAELVIDATGEETVSEYLNDLRLCRYRKVPVLHAWIRGNGEAVQAFWAESQGDACYRCLVVPDPAFHRKQRFPVLKNDVLKRTDGCRAYTPYAVAAPMQAAALAADMVCDWLKGDPSPRFRTRVRENVDVFKIKNQNPTKLRGCPACDPH